MSRSIRSSLICAGVAGWAGIALAQPPVPDANPLECAALPGGDPIEVGTQVTDPQGRALGHVSLSQCSQPAGDGWIKIRTGADGNYELRVAPLWGSRLEDGRLVLPAEQWLAATSVTSNEG